MWIDLDVYDDQGVPHTIPVNMDNMFMYSPIEKNENFPEAKTILYPLQNAMSATLPVRQTVEEIKKLLGESK